ncbi:MAG: LPS export ABC transporter periplasmic protein LptC [Alphaproteobacteria bacterium]
MTVSEPASGSSMSDTASEGQRQSLQQFSFRRERPAFNPLYGRFVGLIKIILPTIATALIVLVAVWPHLNEQKKRFAIGPTQIDASDAENLRMVNPKYTGVDDRRRPYSVTANAAGQSDGKSSLVALDAPKADVFLGDDTWVALTASDGVFDREKQILELTGAVNLFHDSGYEFATSSAVFDLSAGDATGTEPVEGQGPFGRLTAEGFRIHNRGQRVEFLGKAKLFILPKPTSDPKPKNGAAK